MCCMPRYCWHRRLHLKRQILWRKWWCSCIQSHLLREQRLYERQLRLHLLYLCPIRLRQLWSCCCWHYYRHQRMRADVRPWLMLYVRRRLLCRQRSRLHWDLRSRCRHHRLIMSGLSWLRQNSDRVRLLHSLYSVLLQSLQQNRIVLRASRRSLLKLLLYSSNLRCGCVRCDSIRGNLKQSRR